MPPWFYMPVLPSPGESAALDPDEARHAGGARRLNAGDEVCVFDGRGSVAEAVLTHAAGRDVQLRIASIATQEPLSPSLHLAAALPKGDRQNVMLSMATQLGMRTFTPLRCARSIVKPGASFRDRAQRICIEACKQSHRAHLPEIDEAQTVQEVVAARREGDCVLLAHPGGRALAEAASGWAQTQRIVLMIGPEGGFHEGEVAHAQHGGAAVCSLGSGILRTETAVAALLGWFAAER